MSSISINIASLPPGSIIENRYRIVEIIGEGGMSRVYLAEDLRLGTRVAIKENLQTTLESRRQFEQEARILAHLSHPNLPRVIDHFSDPASGRQYLVMDYVEGEDLEAIVQRSGPLSEQVAINWMRQVMDALTYLHSQSPPVVHRDVKPANIKITPQGKAVLVDFGIAKLQGSGTLTGARAFTPGYAPPEQYGLRTTARSDVYALGATLYTLLAGLVPPEAPLRLAGEAPLIPLRQVVPRVSEGVEVAVLKAMAVETTHRWGSVTELQDALQKAGGQAKGETKLLPEIRQERRGMSSRLLAGGIVGAVLIVASLVGWLAIQGRTVPTEIQTSRIVTTAAIQSLAAETEAISVAVITRDTRSANLSVTQTAEARRAAATRAIATQTAHALTATPTLTRTPRPTPTPTATRTPLPTSEIVAGAVIPFRDEFDNLKISSWAEGTNVTMKDGRLWITGHGTWDGVYRDSNMRENEGILILFRFSENSTFEIFVQSGEWETPALRRWGIYGERNSFSPNVYQGSEYTGGDWWIGSMEPIAGRWYFLILEIGGRDEFVARIWDRDNPGRYLEMRQSMGLEWADRTWHIGMATYSGILELDSYQELDFRSVLSGTPTSAAPSAANCPAWFATPEPGKGVLVIENHLGMELYVDATYTSKSWTLPAKQGDTPGRVLLQLPPGHYEYNEHTAGGGRGHIGVDIQAGQMLVSPTGSTFSAEQPAYPLEFPQGCP